MSYLNQRSKPALDPERSEVLQQLEDALETPMLVLCFFLELYAIAVCGYATATLATFFVDQDAENDQAEIAGAKQIQALQAEITALRTAIDQFLTSIPPGYYTIASVEGLKSLLKKRQPLLVDVREASEYRSGHISGAINIPLRTLAHNLDQIPHDAYGGLRLRPVVLYCSSGYRSAMGVMTLHLLGYENVQGFPPSFAGWQAAGEAIASR